MKTHCQQSLVGRCSPRKYARGSMLLELVIALTIFAVAVLGLAKSLNGSLEVANIINKNNRVRIGMRSFLEEVRRKPLAEMSASVTDAAIGVTYTSSTQPVGNLTMTAGQNLEDVYDLKVTASYTVGNQVREETVDVYVYKPATK